MYVDKELESLIKEISDHVGSEWCLLARSLGFTQIAIDGITNAHGRNLRVQISQFFYQWKCRQGTEATPNKLISAAIDANLNDLLKILDSKGFIVRVPRGASAETQLGKKYATRKQSGDPGMTLLGEQRHELRK